MNKFELTGIIIEIFPEQSFSKGFRKREFVIEIGDKYPKKIIFQLLQEKCALVDKYEIGQEIVVSFNVSGRDWTDKFGNTKYFNSLEVWRIAGTGNSSKADESDAEFDSIFENDKPKQKAEIQTNWADDDLPF
jgi:hypothetical protein